MDFKDIIGVGSNVVTSAIAVLTAGWAYFRFLKGRVLEPRLSLSMSARGVRVGPRAYFILKLQMKNEGLFEVKPRRGSVRVRAASGARIATMAVFLGHERLSPGGTTAEEALFELPTNQPPPIHFDFRVEVDRVSFSTNTIGASMTEG